MIRRVILVVFLVLAGVGTSAVLAASPDPKELQIPDQELSKARELVRKLGSDGYRDREEAQAELAKMGRLARPALLDAATTDLDPEVRYRAARLLPKAGADDLKARLDTFLADTEGKYDHDLPGLKQYRKIVGIDKDARDLFVEIIKSPYNVEMLQALDRSTAEGGRAIADRRNTLYSYLQQRNIGGKIIPPQPITLPDIACLIYAETLIPSKEVPRTGMFSHVTGVTFLQQQASVQALSNASTPHAGGYKRIIAPWLESREDVQDLNQLAYPAGQTLREFKESIPLLRKIVTTEAVYGYAKGQALMYLMQQRPKEEFPFLKSLLKNETLVTSVWFGNNQPNQQPQQHQCLLRDVALAMLLSQTNQKMQDYGYIFPPGVVPNQQQIAYGNYAFPDEKTRDKAMVKFGFYQIKYGMNPLPKKDEPPGKGKDKPQPDQRPVPPKRRGPDR